MIRAYVPASLPQVLDWQEAGAIPAGTPVFGVTSALRAAHPEADDEELEYLATAAAHAAVDAGRPAVIAIDVAALHDTLAADVPIRHWAALFVDDLQWYAVSELDALR